MENLGSASPRAIELLKRVQGSNKIVPVTPPGQKPEAKPPVDTSVVAPPEPPRTLESDTPKEEYDFNPTGSEDKKTEPVKAETPADFVPEDPTDEIDALIDPKEPVGKNFKNLRTKLKALNSEHKKAAEELQTLRKKVTDYETGVEIPEISKGQLDRINQLEVYEKLYNFKGSAVYQEKFAKPIAEDQAKLQLLAEEHKVDPTVLNQAFAAESTEEQNRVITQHFKNDLSALEVKSLIKSIKKVQAEAAEAEKEPAQSLARMQAENDRILADKRNKANEAIVHTSKSSWSDSLVELRNDPRFPEITYREGDTEHNEKFVKPILTKAAQEYGRIVRTLAQHGMTELPKDLGMAMARMTQLAHQSAAIAVERDGLRARVKELESLMYQKGLLHRPSMNNGQGAGGSNGSAAPTTAVGPEKAGAKVLSRVMGKR